MKVATATFHMMESFRDVYPNIVSLDKTRENDFDLLIFTGGSDVNPAQYGQVPNGAMGWSDARDKAEFSTLRRWLNGGLKSKKILGVCRGMQLLNVGFGGTLFQDMEHPGVHKIKWTRENPFDELEIVNSLHHQAVEYLGNGYRFSPVILGIEPETQIIESVAWGERVFAVQFHPEFFGHAAKENFFSTVNKWVMGEVNLLEPVAKGEATSKFYTATSDWTIFKTNT